VAKKTKTKTKTRAADPVAERLENCEVDINVLYKAVESLTKEVKELKKRK
jgi:chaperonin cofactor prefoldin